MKCMGWLKSKDYQKQRYVSSSNDFSLNDIFTHLALTLSHISIDRCLENRLKVVRCRIDVLSTALVFTVFE